MEVRLGRRLPDVRVGRRSQTLRRLHHPFSAPKEDQVPLLESDPASCISACYDLVINGSEVGGGSIRIHDPAVQAKVFELIGLTDEEDGREVRLPARGPQVRRPPMAASPSDWIGS